MSSISILLSRLDKVKSTSNNRWLCQCPAHQDKSPSMHIKLDDDGKILINCKAGCDTYSILNAVGLDWDSVFPASLIGHHEKPQKKVLFATEALELIRFEAQIVLVAAYDLSKNKPLQVEELKRLETAMQRITRSLEVSGL